MNVHFEIAKDFPTGDDYFFCISKKDGQRLIAVESYGVGDLSYATAYVGDMVFTYRRDKAEGFRDGAGFDWHTRFVDEHDPDRVEEMFKTDRTAFRNLLDYLMMSEGGATA